MSQIDNKRIAKNTAVLYTRSLLTLFISLFTSRIILQALGVDNYGINSAVGGVTMMFSLVSGSLSSSISRYITFELGHGDTEKLKRIFATSMNIQLIMGAVIVILGETVGVWFLNTHMNIPAGRMTAANWVLQFAIWSFFIGLTQIPYGASIIAHEKMSVYAYFSIFDTILKLVIVYLLYISPYDKLITYSFLGFVVSIGMCVAQRIYCARKFEECHYKMILDKELTRQMSGFASWSFLTNTAWIFNTSGINLLINIFFGVSFNAARGIAGRVESIVTRFYGDFMTAMRPQITKSYAAGEIDEMNKLICQGSRFSYFLLFVLSLPFMYEAYYVLYLWLGMVPDYTVMFYRLSMTAVLITQLGQTGVIACQATGNIKWYTIIITSVGFLVFPFTWIGYKMGLPVEWSYIMYIAIYAILDVIRLFIMRHMWKFPIMMFVKQTLIPVATVTVTAVIVPSILYFMLEQNILNGFIIMAVCFVSSALAVYAFGLKPHERTMLTAKASTIIRHKILRKS